VGGRESDPFFDDLFRYCRQRPGAVAAQLLGETIFRVSGRVFAFLNRADFVTLTVRPARSHTGRLVRRAGVQRARWIGWLGWVTLEVRDRRTLPLAHQLIDESHLLAANRRGRPGRQG
jgi:predicted DNA-binding protein (MmcQ/YjbR family)